MTGTRGYYDGGVVIMMGAWLSCWGRGYHAGGVVTGIGDHGKIGGFRDKMEQTCMNINGRVHECMEDDRGSSLMRVLR